MDLVYFHFLRLESEQIKVDVDCFTKLMTIEYMDELFSLLSTRFYNRCKNEVDCEVSRKLNLIDKTKYRNEDVLHILRSNVNEAMESARIRLEVLDDFVR